MNESRRSRDRYTKYYKSHGAVSQFLSRRLHGVHGAPCDWAIGLYRENAIAIEGEARDPFGGNVYYVTM